jgi:1-acyl-sn-glycerol-3-phosphate acyltransferase
MWISSGPDKTEMISISCATSKNGNILILAVCRKNQQFMLYYLLKVLVWVILQVYFKKIFLTGRGNIPKNKPVVLAANHQSAFIEPTMMGSYQSFPVHFITRGDVFVKKYQWFFRATNQIPIYRFRDGFGGIRKNANTFEACYNVLENNGKILIFAQPGMKWEKRISPVQRGGIRMATGALERSPDIDPYVVPLGINYTDHTRLNSYAMVKHGQPISVRLFMEEYPDDIRMAEEKIAEEVARQQQDLIVHVERPEDEPYASIILEIKENNFTYPFIPKIRYEDDLLRAQIGACKKLNGLEDMDEWRKQIAFYGKQLKDSRITDRVVAKHSRYGLLASLMFYLLSPLALLGILFNTTPLLVAEKITQDKTNGPEFYSSIRAHLGGLLWLLYYFIVVIIAFILDVNTGWFVCISFPVLGLVALWYWDQWVHFKGAFRWRGLPKDRKAEIEKLRYEIDRFFK